MSEKPVPYSDTFELCIERREPYIVVTYNNVPLDGVVGYEVIDNGGDFVDVMLHFKVRHSTHITHSISANSKEQRKQPRLSMNYAP